jgi:MFS family permease
VRSRWTILAVLFIARAAMAFQFQSVAAVAPELHKSLGATLADIGVLIGLYFAAGAALALPGGAIGRRFGDKRTLVAGLVLMLTGEALMSASGSWNAQLAGRLIGGTGGVLLNVSMTKMVADWFAGREIATAMALFVNSWPAGIAVSLMLLPAIATTFGLGAVAITVMVLIAVSILLELKCLLPSVAIDSMGRREPGRRTSAARVDRLNVPTPSRREGGPVHRLRAAVQRSGGQAADRRDSSITPDTSSPRP